MTSLPAACAFVKHFSYIWNPKLITVIRSPIPTGKDMSHSTAQTTCPCYDPRCTVTTTDSAFPIWRKRQASDLFRRLANGKKLRLRYIRWAGIQAYRNARVRRSSPRSTCHKATLVFERLKPRTKKQYSRVWHTCPARQLIYSLCDS